MAKQSALGGHTLFRPTQREWMKEYIQVPWRGAAKYPPMFFRVDRAFLHLFREAIAGDDHTTERIAAIVAGAYYRTAVWKRALVAYALWLTKQNSTAPNFTSRTGALLCRTIDELREDLRIPPRVICHMRKILAEYAYGELHSEVVRTIRRWRLESPKQPFDQWLQGSLGGKK